MLILNHLFIMKLFIILFFIFLKKSYGNKKVVEYLTQYGYLEPPKLGAPHDSFSDDKYESALKIAQKFAGIPATGKLDHQTREMLIAPRCGVPDTGPGLKRFGTGSKWSTRRISYSFTKYSTKLSRYVIEDTFRKAYDTWARPTGLQFGHMTSNTSDMHIGFFIGDHGDGNPFHGQGYALAHAYLPGPGLGGDVHIDDDQNWSTNVNDIRRESYSLLSTATHELGHALGLHHSDVPGAIMRPIYSGQTKLGKDDILGIQSLYGSGW